MRCRRACRGRSLERMMLRRRRESRDIQRYGRLQRSDISGLFITIRGRESDTATTVLMGLQAGQILRQRGHRRHSVLLDDVHRSSE